MGAVTNPPAPSGPDPGARDIASLLPRRFSAPRLRGLELPGADLRHLDLSGFELIGADLVGARLDGARLEGALAHGACLRGASLEAVDATGIQARDIDLEGARLAAAVLRSAVLRHAVLLDADLRGADLSGADLGGADLRGADLSGADLSGAELGNADLTGARLDGARLDGLRGQRACVSRVVDAEGRALPLLIEAGAYTGLHPVFIQAGQVSGRAGRAVGRGLRALRNLLVAGVGVVGGAIRARTLRFQEDFRAKAAEARARQEARRAEAEARQAAWRRKRELREQERVQLAARRLARRRSEKAEREARRLRRVQGAERAPLLPPPSRNVGGPPTELTGLVSRRQQALEARRLQLAEELAGDPVLLQARVQLEQRRREQEERFLRSLEERQQALEEAARLQAEQERLLVDRAAEDARAAERARLEAIRAAEAARLREQEVEARRERRRQLAEQARARLQQGALNESRLQASIEARLREEALALQQQADGTRGEPSAPRRPTDAVEDNLVQLPSAVRPVGIPQGAGADLRGIDLRGRRLGAVDWFESDLRDARLDGAKLDGADLRGARLSGASLEGVRLRKARLEGLQAEGARLPGARFKGASLEGARLAGAELVDADLRGVNLAGADLSGANLTGADLRRAVLRGASLKGAELSAARLADLDLSEVILDEARFEQADLAGVRWDGASVRGAELSGALGLSGRDRQALSQKGARTGEQGLQDLLGGLRSTQLRAAMAILGIGFAAWLGARFLASTGEDPEALAEQAASLRQEDPVAASQAYEELARLTARQDDKVGYLVEAAALAEASGDALRAGALLEEALDEAGSNPGLSSDVRIRKGSWHLDQQEWAQARETVLPLLGLEVQPAETRARAVVTWQEATRALGGPAEGEPDPIAELYASLSATPDSAADLRLAVAELRSGRGEGEEALAELAAAESLALVADQRRRLQETRARVLDRAGELDAAAVIYEALTTAEGTLAARQGSQLALADIRQRQGRMSEAAALVAPLAESAEDPSIRGRALLLAGRLHEQEERLAQAIEAYQQALSIEKIDLDTRDEARISLARVLLSDEGAASAEAAVAGLPPEIASGILAHARLGEARALLDQGQAEAALDIYAAILADESLPEDLLRAGKAGRAEALASLGELAEAVELWRTLLASNPTPEEEAELELQLAHGLLQGGEPAQAADAFASLAASSDPEIRFRGLLGQAEVARVVGERARARVLYGQVADRAPDPAFQVQALQELADLATEDDRPDEALEAWRRLLGVVPPGHAAAGQARLAVMLGLADLGKIDEALSVCRQAVATSSGEERLRARGGCAELLERTEDFDAARRDWLALTLEPGLPADLVADAWLGAARTTLALGEAEDAAELAARGLSSIEATALRLPLLSLRVQALQQAGDPDALARARAERDALVEEAPALAGPLLIQAASEARSQGQLEEAVSLLERAVELPMPPSERAGALVELGDTLLEADRPTEARTRFEAASALEGLDAAARFAAAMGLAEAIRRQGDPAAAAEQLEDIDPPDEPARRWWLESRALLLAEAGDAEGALSAWSALEEAAGGDATTRSTALRGAADAYLALDRPVEALPRYEAAAATASDPAMVGQARLGAALCRAMLGEQARAIADLEKLREHPSAELALQAVIEIARLHAGAERWDAALDVLDGVDAAPLGPAWDASLVETRAAALIALDEHGDAEDAWEALAGRWPDSNEALLPAWLGLAEIARLRGDQRRALEWARRARDAAEDPGYRSRAEDLVAALGGS